MTILEAKEVRDTKGIDCFERALIYSALLLYKSNKNPNNAEDYLFTNAVSITLPNSNAGIAELSIKIDFPINRELAIDTGGNYLNSVLSFNGSNPNPLLIQCQASPPNFMEIVPEPNGINTLEKYFVWAAYTAKANLIRSNNTAVNNFVIQFFNESSGYAKLQIKIGLPIDNFRYFRENNLLCTVLPVLNAPVLPYQIEDVPTSILFNNETNIDNSLLVGNSQEGNDHSINLDNTIELGNVITIGN